MTYFVYDGAMGNNGAAQMVKQCGLHLISKLRHDAPLYFPFAGEYSGRGKPRSMLDLKTVFRARKYTRRIISALGIKSEAFVIDNRIFQAAEIGRIYAKAAWFLAKVLLSRMNKVSFFISRFLSI